MSNYLGSYMYIYIYIYIYITYRCIYVYGFMIELPAFRQKLKAGLAESWEIVK